MNVATGHFSMSFTQAMLLNDEDFMGKPPGRCLGGISSLSVVILPVNNIVPPRCLEHTMNGDQLFTVVEVN
ncbi:hypothetical protein TNCT_428211 [Trichonephila clavata]|uniref:Uncharacterized protein n=1 Tax=Trichonephila clavata TaxID=2740835 RepID=A0A8X6LA51_TRICU|nr:hypothetical protein TNCT_428211 [Trichonephila clavata]